MYVCDHDHNAEGAGMFNKIATIMIMGLTVFFGAANADAQQSTRDTLKSLNFQSGRITLGEELAVIEQTDNYRFLNNADTQIFLTRIWGNPQGAGRNALGMILPTDPNPLTPQGWAVIVTYDPSGYVSDEEAGKIDYDSLLKDMQDGAKENSKARITRGQEPIELIGWARKPFYDAQGGCPGRC